MSGAVSRIDLYDTVNNVSVIYEGRKLFEESALSPEEQRLFARYLQKNPLFQRIWDGPTGIGITLRLQVMVRDGVIYYNGRKYNKDTWTEFFVIDELFYGPPKFIRLQGRMAKETPDVRNTIPIDVIELPDGQKQRVRRACSACGGKLVYDHNALLYCTNCMLIDE